MPEPLVAIINYDFNANAEYLRKVFAPLFPTLLIDSSSPKPPRTADLIIPNSYYPGLWNAAVSAALDQGHDWLFVIASDVKLLQVNNIQKRISDVCRSPDIGVWAPSLHKSSRCASKLCFNRGTRGFRDCSYIEGFCFLVRTEIVQRRYPLPSWNKSGWGVDVVTAWLATEMGYRVRVDDRLVIYHPKARTQHRIDRDPAYADLTRYREAFGITQEMMDNFFFSDYIQLRAEGLIE